MPQPADGPTSGTQVKAWLQVSAGDETQDAVVDLVVPAVNAYVRDLPIAEAVDALTWPDRIILGATMLGARLVRRRNSPTGTQPLADPGAVAYVARTDPDIAAMLQLGIYAVPQAR